jgi:hypothetical protein
MHITRKLLQNSNGKDNTIYSQPREWPVGVGLLATNSEKTNSKQNNAMDINKAAKTGLQCEVAIEGSPVSSIPPRALYTQT